MIADVEEQDSPRFDPAKEFTVVSDAPSFDPSRPYSVVTPRFDPSREFKVVETPKAASLTPLTDIAAPLIQLDEPSKLPFTVGGKGVDVPEFDPSQPFNVRPPSKQSEPSAPLSPIPLPPGGEMERIRQRAAVEGVPVLENTDQTPLLQLPRPSEATANELGSDISAGISGLTGIQTNPQKIGQAMSGVVSGLEGVIEAISTPEVLTALAAGRLHPALGKAVAAAFTGAVARSLPQQAKMAAVAFGEGDIRKGFEATTGAVVGAAILPELGKSALSSVAVRAETAGAPKTAEAVRQVTEASSLTFDSPKIPDLTREGPGAATAATGFPRSGSTAGLNQMIESHMPDNVSVPERIRIKQAISDIVSSGRDVLAKALDAVKTTSQTIWDQYSKYPQFTEFKKALGEFTGALNISSFHIKDFLKQIEKAVPDKLRREAIVNFIQAKGDTTVLASRAAASKPKYAKGYEMALKLTPEEIQIATDIQAYLDAKLVEGMNLGMLGDGIENYVTQIWKKDDQIAKNIVAEFSNQKLKPSFDYARKRVFDSYFEGEQAGFEPKNKDIGALVAAYDEAFNKSVASRSFIKALTEGNAEDGRPLVAVSGQGSKILDGTGKVDAALVKPNIKPEEAADYVKIDHSALRKWQWATEVDGTPVFVEGNLLVHPEIANHVKALTETSKVRSNPVLGPVLKVQGEVKQAMMSLSLFHQVQEGLHAYGHTVNPFKPDRFDPENPTHVALVNHGLQIADVRAAQLFGEGLSSGGLMRALQGVAEKTPLLRAGLAQMLKKAADYQDWLFSEYIPALKISTATEMVKRNTERYGKELSQDQILEMSAEQANRAYGELNYKYMGRHPTTQDAMRVFLLAPDFLEARAKFTGEALKPYGREQLRALGILAVTQFVAARILNQALDDEWHWDKPFMVVYKGKQYGFRTIPADIEHLFEEPRQFTFNRLSPFAGRGLIEALTGRDSRGVKRDFLQQVGDMAKSGVPISLRTRDDLALWEKFLNSAGMHEKRFSPSQEIRQLADEWMKKNAPTSAGEFIYDFESDPYRPLKTALRGDDTGKIKEALDKLKETHTVDKIDRSVKAALTRPFTGSQAQEVQFLKTLNDAQRLKYQEARKESQEEYSKFVRALQGR